MKTEPNETMKEATSRLERILESDGIEYNRFDTQLRDEDGNVVEKDT